MHNSHYTQKHMARPHVHLHREACCRYVFLVVSLPLVLGDHTQEFSLGAVFLLENRSRGGRNRSAGGGMNSFAYIILLGYHSWGGSKDSRGGIRGCECPPPPPPPLKETLVDT